MVSITLLTLKCHYYYTPALLQWSWNGRYTGFMSSFLLSVRLCFFSLKRPFVHGLFVSWGATGWWFIINSHTNFHVTIDCSTVLPLVLGVVTRQKLQYMGLWYWELMSRPDLAVLPVGTLHSFEWFWVSRRIFIYSHHNTLCSSLGHLSVCPSVCGQNHVRFVTSIIPAGSISYLHILLMNFRRCVTCNVAAKFKKLNFWQIFQICCFDLVLFWLGIWYESIVWLIMGWWGVFSECRCFSCFS